MQLSDIVSRFQSPKKNGNNSFMVRCPCHNDSTQSLSISEENGKILLNCFAGCRTEDILHSAGLEMKDLFSDKPSCATPKPPSVEYIYSDKLKKIRYYIQNNGQWKKSFCWKHKDESGKWQSGKGNCKVPLYKQNLLSDVPADETVYIVEGEKDCDTMTDKLRFRTVSAPNGATKRGTKNKWNSKLNSLFRNLNVAIIPDNDEVGRAYAETIAGELLPFAKSVKIINLCEEWENLKQKGDITDVYETEQPARGMSVAQAVAFKLSALTVATPDYIPSEMPETTEKHCKENYPLWTYGDGDSRKIKEQLYITEFIKFHNVKCINNKLYSVDGAVDDGKARQIIISEILPYVKTNHGDKAEKLLKGIKALCYTEPPKPSLDKLHFKNGTLSKDSSGKFTVFSREKEFCINRFPVNYNPDAEAPQRFLKYLDEVYYSDDQKTLKQYCGYCLLPTTVMQKALIIIGEGGEGKSVLGAILNGVIGESNCYNESVGVLQTTFGIANVEGKLIFIDDDLSENALKNARAFKNLVTNKTTISAQKKFVQDNQIKPYVRFVCFGNFTLQALYDISEGFHRRQLILQAKPKDKNRIDNPFIDSEIIENEGEGVMNWLVQGLNELIANNFKIYTSERTDTTSENFKHENDSVYLFLTECEGIQKGKGLQAHSASIFTAYQKFCSDNALTALKERNFLNSLKSKGREFNIEKVDYPFELQTKAGKKKARGFDGISVNDSYIFINF